MIEFQQRLGEKIPREEAEELFRNPFPTDNINTWKTRKKIMKRKLSKADYEEYLRQMREDMRNR